MKIKLDGTENLKLCCRRCGSESIDVNMFDRFNGLDNLGIVTYGGSGKRTVLVYSIPSIKDEDVLPDCVATHTCQSCGASDTNLAAFVKRPHEM